MKAFSVRLPELLLAEIEAESRKRRISKSEVVRERLHRSPQRAVARGIADLIGSVEGLPADLSARAKQYLKAVSPFEQNAQPIDRVGKWRKAVGAAASESRVVLRDFRARGRMDR